jgi:AraC-like DNA-binding protein
MATARRDTRGIMHPRELNERVRFRRRLAAEPLRPYVEHYWLIDWDLDRPFEQHVVPHPCVNVVWQDPDIAIVVGVESRLSSTKLDGAGRVLGAQFRPGAFRGFLGAPVKSLNDRRLGLGAVFGDDASTDTAAALRAPDDDARVAAVDAWLLGLLPDPDTDADLAMRLAHLARTDRSITRVDALAAAGGVSVRSLQRLFGEHVGVGPKWVIRRYRIHEAIERSADDVDWGRLAVELGYADQSHLVRDFTAATGMSPAAYARHLSREWP